MGSRPTLWHIEVSHYNEKARWALDYKGIEHQRRAPPPGAHMAIALGLTRGRYYTFPVLTLEGRSIGDSSAIIAALEERFPDPPLYPADPEQRKRALELEDWFDEQLGPPIRLAAWHAVGRDPDRMADLASRSAPGPLARLDGVNRAVGRAFTAVRFGASDTEAAERARGKTLEALDRLEHELGSGDYLVGDRFTVADLTAAALFYPLALPPEGPVTDEAMPESWRRFREPLTERPGLRWVREMFRRHRRR